jgi:hypothetical protein
VPKEMDRYRLAKGLQDFTQNAENLSPMQQYAQLLSIPGAAENPQLIQTFGELARQQNIRNAYGKGRPTAREPVETTPKNPQPLSDVNFANVPINKINRRGQANLPSDYINAEAQAKALPGAISENPYAKKFEPIPPWTPQQRDDAIAFHLNRDPTLSLQGAKDAATDDERREREQPTAQQEIRDKREGIEEKADAEFDKQLATILQKEGKEIYADLTGDTLLNLKKAMRNDLATNPSLNEKTAAEKWIRKGAHLAEQKQALKILANRDLSERISPSKKEEALKKLRTTEKIFSETGNNKELFNILKSSPDKGGFELSPGGSAIIAFPRSEPVKEIINKNKRWPLSFGKFGAPNLGKNEILSRKFAEEIGKAIHPSDSFLAIAREMKDRNPNFNEIAFFDYLRENQDDLGLTPRLRDELGPGAGVSDIFPNWGDIALFPAFTKSVAND